MYSLFPTIIFLNDLFWHIVNLGVNNLSLHDGFYDWKPKSPISSPALGFPQFYFF